MNQYASDVLEHAPQRFADNSQTLGHLYRNAAEVVLAAGDAAQAAQAAQAATLARKTLAVYGRAEAVEPQRRERAEQLLAQAEAMLASGGG